MIVFRTPGILDIRAATTMGVNVKNNDSPIGFFGTGLKYAIAILLRERQSISITTAEGRFDFSVLETNIRGKPFSIITMNGKELGFTTEFGKKWPLWMAYRELICNTWDEGGTVNETSDAPSSLLETVICVKGTAFAEVHRNSSSFLFPKSSQVFNTSFGEVLFRPSSKIFYRGIAVYNLPKDNESLFTYNITEPLELTEERTAAAQWQLEFFIQDILIQLPSDLFIKATTTKGCFENNISFSDFAIPSKIVDLVGSVAKHKSLDLNPSLLRIYRERTKGTLAETVEHLEMDSVRRTMLDRAVVFAQRLGFSVDDYEILCVERIGNNVLGMAAEGKIFISQKAFEAGTKIVAGTLIEEFIHLRENLNDETRALQDYLLNKIVSLGEQINGEPL